MQGHEALRSSPSAPCLPRLALTPLWLLLVSVSQGKVHGSLARAGKVRGQTPKVAKKEKAKKQTMPCQKRLQYNRRFVNIRVGVGKKKGPNTQPLGKMG